MEFLRTCGVLMASSKSDRRLLSMDETVSQRLRLLVGEPLLVGVQS